MKKTLLILIVSVFAIVSCQKAELKKPTAVNFALDLNKSFGPDSKVKMVSGGINITEFRINGDRLEGEDIAFSRSFGDGLSTDLNGSGEVSDLDFDLPQGEYLSISLDFDIKPNGSDHAFFLEGTYKQSQGPTVGLRFEFDAENNFVINGEDGDQNATIIMDKDLGKKVKIEFDPIYWFDGLTTNQLDNATITPQQGQDVIILSTTENVALYEVVANRMTTSNRAIFE